MSAASGEPAADGAEVRQWVRDTCRGLGLPVEEPEDDFFATGGTSLTAMKFIARVEERYGETALAPDDLYERSSVREIADSIAHNTSASRQGAPTGT